MGKIELFLLILVVFTLVFISGYTVGSTPPSGNEYIYIEPPPEQPILKSLGTFKLTAYCACKKCCGKSNGITASGARAVEGVTVAADKRFPFGTKLIIDGHEYTVQDRGGAIKSNRIDIYFTSHKSALKFGVQYAEVFVKEAQK